MSNVDTAFLISLLLIGLGYLIKRLSIVREEDGKVVSKLVLYVTFPALVLHTVPTLKITSSLLILPIIALLFGIGVLLVSFRLFRHHPSAQKGILLMAVIGFNIGLFAYPIIEAVWGKTGLLYIAMFDIGNAFLVLVLSYGVGAVYSPRREIADNVTIWRTLPSLFRSVPLICYLVALVLNFTQVSLPPVILELISVLARANMALVLLLLGVYVRIDFDRRLLISVARVLSIRYGFGLIVGLTLFYWLPFDRVYRAIVLIALILPVGLTIIPFADEFSYDTRFAGTVANLTIIISFGLMWLLITWLHLV